MMIRQWSLRLPRERKALKQSMFVPAEVEIAGISGLSKPRALPNSRALSI